jgi:RNA polymerase sigma-70 factor (sigma-E family)
VGNLYRDARVYRDMNAQTLRGVTVVHQDSFEDYVRASGPRLKRLAFLLTGDLDEAEDLLQSAYAKAMPHWSKVSGYDVPDAYMRRVMVSIRTSWWRRSRGRETLVPEIPERRVVPPGVGESVVDSQMLLTALRALPERQRAAVVLRHWCDLSEAETAVTMGCSVGTVKSTTSKALARLRAGLAVTTNVSSKGEAS